ncbi:TPA: glycosyltransferase [Streptococcus suis]|nr:glycosyltransferase [Streptococcus suis]
MKKYKILVTGMSPALAGTETFIMTYYRNLDPEKFQLDFIVRTKEKIIFQDEILERGSKIIYIPRKRQNYSEYKKVVESFFSEQGKEYDALWYNAMGIPNIDLLELAKRYGIRTRIIHSHSSTWKGNLVTRFFHEWNRLKLKKTATHYFACSDLAADYMFEPRILGESIIIQNAIDMDRFTFSEADRDRLRKELGWHDKQIIGTVGRYDIQKNQPFLIDVFYQAVQKNDQLRLVIIGAEVGTNSTISEIKEKIVQYGLEDKVLLPGTQFDMKSWLSAFDLFILPSLFEGLPLSAVEAQANGLPILVSDTITRELDILGNVQYLGLGESLENWSLAIEKGLQIARTTEEKARQAFKEKGFDIHSQVKEVEKILLGE